MLCQVSGVAIYYPSCECHTQQAFQTGGSMAEFKTSDIEWGVSYHEPQQAWEKKAEDFLRDLFIGVVRPSSGIGFEFAGVQIMALLRTEKQISVRETVEKIQKKLEDCRPILAKSPIFSEEMHVKQTAELKGWDMAVAVVLSTLETDSK